MIERSSSRRTGPIVALEGVTKRFPGVVANDGVDLMIRRGEVHVLLGENGAGKSTLIGMLSGLHQPDEGEIRVDGRRCGSHRPAGRSDSASAPSFSTCMLVPTLTVAENLSLGGPWWQRLGRGRDRAPVRSACAPVSASASIPMP